MNFVCAMAAMIIANQQAPGTSISWLCLWDKAVFKPVRSDVVTRPAVLRLRKLLVLHLFGLQIA
jgi:hypothetical protein